MDCDFLEFPSVNSSKIFTAHRILRDTNFKHEKSRFVQAVFSIFANIYLLPLRKNLFYRLPWKTSSDLRKIFTTSLPNFTEFYRRKREKIHCHCCFLCSCWRHKISKNTDVFLRARADYLSFRPQRACDRKTIGSHLKYRFIKLDLVTVGKFCFHFSRVLGSVVDCVSINPSARVALKPALRDAQNVCALTKVGTVLNPFQGIIEYLPCTTSRW